jgi:O-antigen/teichoic acid export membrane protein
MSESPKKGLIFIRKILLIVGGCTFLIFLMIFVFTENIVDIVLGDNYRQSVIVLKIIAFFAIYNRIKQHFRHPNNVESRIQESLLKYFNAG